VPCYPGDEGTPPTVNAAVRAMIGWIVRTVLGLALLFAAVTPSLAELGCFEDALRHGQEAVGASTDSGVDAPVKNNDERPLPLDRATHCSVSHCAQWVPVAPPAPASHGAQFNDRAYPGFVAHKLGQSLQDGPERPPRT
jgi:hypothetical protein